MTRSNSDYYTDVATYYDEDVSMGFEARAEVNSSLDRIRNDFRQITIRYPFSKVLEIGCGPGFDIHWFATQYPDKEFVAVDISKEMVKLTQKRLEKDQLKNASVFQADERQLLEKFGHNSFDLIYVYFGALNTVEDLDRSAQQIYDLLQPGGTAVLTFVNKWYLRELVVQMLKLNLKLAFARLGKVWSGYSVSRFLPSHCYSPKRIKKAFSAFKLQKTKGYSIVYPPWYNDHKVKNNPQKADKLWQMDQKLQKTSWWSKGEYTLFVFQK